LQTSVQNPITSKVTMIAGGGQPGFSTTTNITSSFKPSNYKNAFTGTAGATWDNPTLTFNFGLNDSSYAPHITAHPDVCLTFLNMVTVTRVVDTDADGKLDIWETAGVHLNPGDATHPATFGTCADYPAEPCLNLPAMGLNPNVPDIVVEIDWMHGVDGH